MAISDSQIVVLNLIELGVAVFRGPDASGWTEIADQGMPDLLYRVQKNNCAAIEAPLRELASSLAHALGGDQGPAALETEYVRLFVAGHGGVPAPLYESCHQGGKGRTMGQSALDMQARLEEAGLSVSLDSNEPPDHLTIELEYLFYLLSEGWTGSELLATKGVDFAESVMLPWVRRFRDALSQADPHPVFVNATDLVAATLSSVRDV